MPDIAIIIPCRLASVRFPRKLLYPIDGKPLILWTAERIAAQVPQLPLYFAVADTEIADVLEEAGYRTVATPQDVPSGTDRLAAANAHIGARTIINVQADEPLVDASHIRLLVKQLNRPSASIATLAAPFQCADHFYNPDNVKVVCDTEWFALYFSRAPIPYPRDTQGRLGTSLKNQSTYCHHLGLYAYKAEFLKKFSTLAHGPLEHLEKLEQLRALENGFRIAVGLTPAPTFGIDTLADAREFQSRLKRSKENSNQSV